MNAVTNLCKVTWEAFFYKALFQYVPELQAMIFLFFFVFYLASVSHSFKYVLC